MENANTKWCGHCRQWLPVSEFQRNCTKPDGLQTFCKTYNNTRNRRAK